MTGFFKPKGGSTPQEKSIWTMLDQIKKASYPDSPWCRLLGRYGCVRDAPQLYAPCPCVWRRPATGAVSREEQREYRWDWRSAPEERKVRLALSHRENTRIPR